MTEIFKDIPGYEGLYQVSNTGQVKSLPKSDGNGNKERLLIQEVIKRTCTNYNRVTLSKYGTTKRYSVHRLVAEAFIPNLNNLPIVNHIGNNGENNYISNLEWCTHEQNMLHSFNQGRQDSVKYAGGIAAGAIKKDKAIKGYETLVNKTFGNLLVQSYYIDTNILNPKVKFVCLCTCGNITEKNLQKLKSGVQACKECTYKIRSQTRNKMKI